MYAVIETGSKQYRVSEGDVIQVETLPAEEGKTIQFDKVLMVSNDDKLMVGQPFVEGASVEATVKEHGRGKKIIVYRHKKNYHRKLGHRQNYTSLEINSINLEVENGS